MKKRSKQIKKLISDLQDFEEQNQKSVREIFSTSIICLHDQVGFPVAMMKGETNSTVVQNFDNALDMARKLLGEVDTSSIEEEDGLIWFPQVNKNN